tara:strand:+ start:166 stop:876 length:711 start_codon:yes stop_codon:yes gene_type:complete
MPLSSTARHIAPMALRLFISAALHVKGLSDEVVIAINAVTDELILNIQSKNGSQSNINELAMNILPIFTWIHTNKGYLIKRCRIVELIETVEPSLRAWLKGEEYTSPHHIMEVYHRKYKDKLHNMALPIQIFDRYDIEQALKDLNREVVNYNNEITIGNIYHICVYIYIYIYIYICIYIHICILCMYVHVHIYVYMYMYFILYASLIIYVYIYMYMYMYYRYRCHRKDETSTASYH